MLERFSVPRRAFDFEDYVDILRRNVRWVLAPAFLGLVISTAVAYFMPDTFVSSARIRIVPQQVKESLVETTSNQLLIDHINAMAETIKSRNTLTSLITEFGLYKKEMKKEPLEDVINIMGPAIRVTPTSSVANVSGRALPTIQISFTYGDPVVAQKVCQEIVSRFMNENIRDRMDNLLSTDQFLNEEYDHAKRELELAETKLSDFRMRNAGRLPEEMGINLSQMNTLGSRLGQLNEAASRNDEQRLMLETEVRVAKTRLDSLKETSQQAQARNERVIDLDRQIQAMESSIASMRERYTDDFPDLQQSRAQLALLKRQREDANKQDKADKAAAPKEPHQDSPGVGRERLDIEANLEQLKTALANNATDGRNIAKEITQVNAATRSYQGRVESLPVGEKEYADLIRDRDFAKSKFEEMEGKQHRSKISMDMENRKQGESLELLDQASRPETPVAPKRTMIIPMGPIIGFLLGVVLIAVREMKDTSLKNLKDARLYTQLSILGSVPLLENDLVVQRRKQMMWVGWATATLVGLAVIAGSVAHYYMNRV